jgi:hypothetical protein
VFKMLFGSFGVRFHALNIAQIEELGKLSFDAVIPIKWGYL